MATAAPNIVVRRIRPEDWRVLRGVRLRALADAPEAFGSTFAAEEAQDRGFWERRAAGSHAGSAQAIFLAFVDGGVMGMVGGYRSEEEPDVVELVAMWVDPSWRRVGLGRRLVDHLLGWATDEEANSVRLWLVDGNDAARTLYASKGFTPTDRTLPLPSQPDLTRRLHELRPVSG